MNKIVYIFDTHEQINIVNKELKKVDIIQKTSVITKDSKNKELKYLE